VHLAETTWIDAGASEGRELLATLAGQLEAAVDAWCADRARR
jgi:hypothetical protein